jgi:hypothetical protein
VRHATGAHLSVDQPSSRCASDVVDFKQPTRGDVIVPDGYVRLSTADIHGHRVSPAEMQDLVERLQLADDLWDIAQAASDNPPPDPGFPRRIRSLARACEHEAGALGRAASVQGFGWTPLPDQRHMIISHELRPGADRPGPPKLWQEFDRAVQRLGIAMEGRIMHAVALQYRDLATVMHEIADLLLGETPETRGRSE